MAKSSPLKKGNKTKPQLAVGNKAKMDSQTFHVKEERSNRWSLTMDYTAQVPKTSKTSTVRVTGSIVRKKDKSHRLVVRYLFNGTTNRVMHTRDFGQKIPHHQVESEAYAYLRGQASVIAHSNLGNIVEVNKTTAALKRTAKANRKTANAVKQLTKLTTSVNKLAKAMKPERLVVTGAKLTKSLRRESNVDKLFAGNTTKV
jgi:fructosamine-3-kinase